MKKILFSIIALLSMTSASAQEDNYSVPFNPSVNQAILTLTGNFKAYDSVVALTGGGPGDASYVPALYMYNTAFSYMRYGYGSVIAKFILLECLLATALVSWLMRKDNLV